ncbi:MAG: site-specific DNA-methyltransferase [Anaerolineaceae bacterium]|nr:site-specific DNA-methyltransferase [Anaerolineaceae bacterium]
MAFLGDSLDFLRQLPDASIDLIMTSPPFALKRKKEYGNVHATEYIDWFMDFALEFYRVLKDTGSLVVDIGGSWIPGQPTRSLYHFELISALSDRAGFHLAQEFFWYNPSKLPSPAEWVTVRRIRVKDAVNMVWWLSKTPHPKANNRRVLKPYSESMKKLLENGYKAKLRPSGHDISENFSKNNKGAIPANLLVLANTDSNGSYLRQCREQSIKPHPARFPHGLPEFFVQFLTDPGDVVLDPFAGSNVTGEVAENNERHWLAFELVERYLRTSRFRFPDEAQPAPLFDLYELEEAGFEEETKEAHQEMSREFFALVRALHEQFVQDNISMNDLSERFSLEENDVIELFKLLSLSVPDFPR